MSPAPSRGLAHEISRISPNSGYQRFSFFPSPFIALLRDSFCQFGQPTKAGPGSLMGMLLVPPPTFPLSTQPSPIDPVGPTANGLLKLDCSEGRLCSTCTLTAPGRHYRLRRPRLTVGTMAPLLLPRPFSLNPIAAVCILAVNVGRKKSFIGWFVLAQVECTYNLRCFRGVSLM